MAKTTNVPGKPNKYAGTSTGPNPVKSTKKLGSTKKDVNITKK